MRHMKIVKLTAFPLRMFKSRKTNLYRVYFDVIILTIDLIIKDILTKQAIYLYNKVAFL